MDMPTEPPAAAESQTQEEAKHGVTFDDYAATSAYQAQGKALSELLPILGIEEPQWDEVSAYWLERMANDEDFALATRLGEAFQDPAIGKYARMEAPTSADALAKVPDLEAFAALQAEMDVAAGRGIDAQAFLGTKGLNVGEYSAVSMHYMDAMNAARAAGDDETTLAYARWMNAYRDEFREAYEADSPTIGDDIEF